jgi:multiple sugar transport system permease protein
MTKQSQQESATGFSPSPTRKKKKFSWDENLAGYAYLSPWLIGFVFFIFLPIAASFVLAFTKYDILSAPKWVGLANFEKCSRVIFAIGVL